MFTLSNILSFIRAPLALVFLQKNIPLRIASIFCAMLSDSVDGYLARKNKSASKFGAFLDPAMDKFFVYFVLTILYLEESIKLWQVGALLSRDFALLIYGIYLISFKKFDQFEIKAIRWGKVTTALQFVILLCITEKIHIFPIFYFFFVVLGVLSFLELTQRKKIPPNEKIK